jgi:hypothetical protein
MNWLHYLLEANLYLAVAYGCYWLLFRKQTFYTANRIYLLASMVFCFLIPLVQVGAQAPLQPVVQTVQTTAAVVYASETTVAPETNLPFLTPNKALQTMYWLVAASMCVWLITKLYSLLKLVFTHRRSSQNNLTLVYVNDEHTPFSFFGYLFVDPLGKLDEAMLRHEMVHISQKHSWDIMFTEVVKMLNWFNPVVYLLQNSLKALHEFEADRLAAGTQQAPDSYVDFLIAQAYRSNGLPFAHQFSNKQLLKSRIMKLYQKRSGKLARLSYLMAVPLCAGLLCASSLAFSKDYGWIKIELKRLSPAVQATKLDSVDTSKKNNLLLVQYLNNPKKNRILDSVAVFENDGKKHVYSPLNVTDEDLVRLKRDYKVWIQIMHFPRNPRLTAKHPAKIRVLAPLPPQPIKLSKLKSIDIPPPPPPPASSPSHSKPVYKGTQLPPPPPPPSVVRFPLPKKAIKPAKAGTIKFPPPRVYDELGKELKPASDNQSVALSIIKPSEAASRVQSNMPNFQKYQGFTDYISKTFKFPYQAIANQTAGYTMVAFQVNSNHMLSNAHVTESLSRETDAAILTCFNSYKAAINAKPGEYTMGFILAIEGAIEKDPVDNIKTIHGFNFGKKVRTGKEPQPNTLTMMLTGKQLQPRTPKIQKPATTKPEVKTAKKSFIESETMRFKAIASFTKPKPSSPCC